MTSTNYQIKEHFEVLCCTVLYVHIVYHARKVYVKAVNVTLSLTHTHIHCLYGLIMYLIIKSIISYFSNHFIISFILRSLLTNSKSIIFFFSNYHIKYFYLSSDLAPGKSCRKNTLTMSIFFLEVNTF